MMHLKLKVKIQIRGGKIIVIRQYVVVHMELMVNLHGKQIINILYANNSPLVPYEHDVLSYDNYLSSTYLDSLPLILDASFQIIFYVH